MNNPLSKALDRLLITPISSKVTENVEKTLSTKVEKKEDKPKTNIGEMAAYGVNIPFMNAKMRGNVKDKPEGRIDPNVLRDFSINYPIARACIDYLKTKVTQLEWDIVNKDDEKDTKENKVRDVKEYFLNPCGDSTTFREFTEKLIEDNLVMGAVTLEKARTRGGNFLYLLPVDPATIKVRVNEKGRVPTPPEIAYEQWIRGVKTAELTSDEMIFRVRNSRSNTIFGLSPLESLIIQVRSSLAGSLYNLKFLTSSNMVEGFMEMPEGWSMDQIKEFQRYFDAMVSGDPRQQRKIKFMPTGSKFTPTKKPDDMAFKDFETWLLRQTCAIFGVPPQDIGFTEDVNRTTADVQAEKGDERGKRPLAMFLEETFTDVIERDLGYMGLKFKFLNVDPVDKKREAEIDEIRLRSGVLDVNEVRNREGLEPVDVKRYVSSNVTLAEKLGEMPEMMPGMPARDSEEKEKEPEEEEDMERTELIQWRRCSVNDLKAKRDFREFSYKHLDDQTVEEIKGQLQEVNTLDGIFKVFEPHLNGTYDAIKNLKKVSSELRKRI